MMVPPMPLDDIACRACGEDALFWYWKDESETALEVLVECDNCGVGYPKRVVNKREDTRQAALEYVARKVVGT